MDATSTVRKRDNWLQWIIGFGCVWTPFPFLQWHLTSVLCKFPASRYWGCWFAVVSMVFLETLGGGGGGGGGSETMSASPALKRIFFGILLSSIQAIRLDSRPKVVIDDHGLHVCCHSSFEDVVIVDVFSRLIF